jgi:hypothetical protein
MLGTTLEGAHQERVAQITHLDGDEGEQMIREYAPVRTHGWCPESVDCR